MATYQSINSSDLFEPDSRNKINNFLSAIGTYTAPTIFASTIVGFSGTPSQAIYTTQIGKMYFVQFQISGTSNANNLTFTVPVASLYLSDFVVRIEDNGTFAIGLAEVSATSTTINVYKDIIGSGFTTSGAKAAQGMITYVVA